MADLASALNAYLSLVARLGASAAVLDERRALLQDLLARQGAAKRTQDAYPPMVEALLAVLSPPQKVLAMTCAREFFYFWLDDMKRVVEITSRSGFSTHNPVFPIESNFDLLIARIEGEAFESYPPSLELFLGKLFEDGMANADIRPRELILQALLYLLEPHPFRSTSYRMAVDALLLHLSDSGERELLLETVRAYFPYWQSFPFAHQRQAAGDEPG
ncbi:hypothetical protein [Chromobacterium sp. IIBBL 290-4]|uniref:hypothetical protein n=1 Tax=Chromobacterium sp. IIBBL 290-4 TaxID=2953890 RepID=UPI0020B7E5A0|nr:hypothetical protein [Chromobacterium sp. IIBBL 290-4]UTH74791.1 hypothetical protein NKT35_01405 [Chromobacterium sp. IIBBL 290-4]